jgi:RNA polymerase sigma factor (sigma-70 family)
LDFDKELKKYISTIHYFAKRMYFESSVCDKDDLVQVGMLGMIDGLRHFNKQKSTELKTKKSTYVIGCIRNAMLEEANKFYGPLRLPHRKKLRLNAFKKMVDNRVEKSVICKKMKMSDAEFDTMVRLAKQARKDTILLPIDLEDINNVEPEDIPGDVFCGKNLTDDEKNILDMRIFRNMTYAEIGKTFGVKRETMRKRVISIFSKIREELKDEDE